MRELRLRKILEGMDKEICVIGAGGHAKVVIETAELLGYSVKGIYDQNKEIKEILGYTVSHESSEIEGCERIFFALGSNVGRERNVENFGGSTFNLIHPSAICSKNIMMGEGNVIMAGAIINSSSTIAGHCIINTGACIDHDCTIEDFVHISPRAAIAGNVTVQKGAQVGIGACVKQNITIGKWAVVGAGAVVVKDVPDHAVVVGNPARILEKR